MHVLDNVRQRIEAGLRDFVSEIRVCTVLFLGFPSLQVRTTRLCSIVSARQRRLTKQGMRDSLRSLVPVSDLVLSPSKSLVVCQQEERDTGGHPNVDSVQMAALLVQRRMQAHEGTCLQVSRCN